MNNFSHIIGFDWDDGNARKNEDHHNVTQLEAEQVFFNQPLLVIEDVRHSQVEQRYHALGKTDDGRQLHLTYTLRFEGTKIRIISARPMHKNERKVYEQKN